MRGLKHSGEYALILSEDELVLFKCIFGSGSRDLWRCSKVAKTTDFCSAEDHSLTCRLLADTDIDIIGGIQSVLTQLRYTKLNEYHTES